MDVLSAVRMRVRYALVVIVLVSVRQPKQSSSSHYHDDNADASFEPLLNLLGKLGQEQDGWYAEGNHGNGVTQTPTHPDQVRVSAFCPEPEG
jgi:hypothetical protein